MHFGLRAMVSTCLPSMRNIFSSLHYFLRSLGFHIFSGGGGSCRRQGKSAAPRGRRASVVGLIRVLAASFGHDEVKRARGGRVRASHRYQPPAQPPRFFKESATFWGVRGGGGVWRDFVV